MHKEFVLSLHQQSLVESHLYIVRDTLRFRIRPIESSTGLGYDDLYQEGCLWLCWAAFSYVEDSAAFATYAKKVVVNGLLSYCRETKNHNKHFLQLEISETGDIILPTEELRGSLQSQMDLLEIIDLLKSAENAYHGVARLGIQSLAKSVQGFGVTEIANSYQVPASHVGAWISRASSKLRNDEAFLAAIR